MKRIYTLATAITTASCLAFAQEAVTTERTETKQSSDGKTSTKTTTKVSSTEYVNHMRTVYTSAGIAETKVERLMRLEQQLHAAYAAGNISEVRRIRVEIRELLDADITRVHTYIQSHPLPATFPDFVVNTYAPEAAFTRDITISGVGVRPAGGVDVNVNRTESGSVRATTGGGTATSAGGSVSGSTSSGTTGEGTSTPNNTDASGAGTVGGTSSGTTGGTSTGGTSTGSTGGTSSGSTGTGSTGGTSSGSTGGSSSGGTQ